MSGVDSRKLARALRWIAVGQLLPAAHMLIFTPLRRSLLQRALSRGPDTDRLFEQLKQLGTLSAVLHMLAMGVCGWGALLLCRALSRQRGYGPAVVAALLLGLHLSCFAVEQVVPAAEWGGTGSLELRWLVLRGSEDIGILLLMVAGALAGAWARPQRWLVVGGAALVAVFDVALVQWGRQLFGNSQAGAWVHSGILLLGHGWVAGFCLKAAAVLARDLPPAAAEPAGGPPSPGGSALRLLAWGLLGRVVVGLTLQIAGMVALRSGSYDNASAALVLASMCQVLLTLVLVTALLNYQRLPETHRGDSVLLVVTLCVVALPLDLFATYSGVQLFGLIGEARRATSFWGVPSLSKMKGLEEQLTWAGRLAQGLGLAAGLLLLSTLRRTAQALDAKAQEAQITLVSVLLLVGGCSAFALVLMLTKVRRSQLELLLLLAGGLLILAVVALVNWLQLLFALARRLDAEANQSSKSAGAPEPLPPG